MKCQIYYTALFLLSFFLTSSSCDTTNMPDEDKDWNVLEWTVEGERYKAECEGDPLFGCDPADCQFYPDIGSLSFSTVNDKHAIYISTSNNNPLQLGTNNISKGNSYVLDRKASPTKRLTLDKSQKNTITLISIDSTNKIITGEFELSFKKNSCQLKLDDGYFKLSYRP